MGDILLIKLFILLFLLLAVPSAWSNTDKIASHPVWLKLLHYKIEPNIKSTRMSNKTFFLDKNGPTDPMSELDQTVKMIKNPELSKKLFNAPLECIYPARVYWLTKNYGKLLNLKNFSIEHCLELNLFYKDIAAKAISYVYIGPFMSNAASIMGHSILMLKKPGRSTIVNYAMSYSARLPKDVDPLTYITKGLLGGFGGIIKVEPFYHKIVEYRKIENRNMWEFELNLSEEEVQLITYHLWELKRGDFFKYYFFDENCAYLLVALIDMARPELNLIDQLSMMVLPNKIPELLSNNNLIKKQTYYPSYKEKLLFSYDQMSKNEKKFYIKNKDNLDLDTSLVSSPKLIDTFLNHLNHYSIHDEGKLKGKKKKLFDTLVMNKISLGSPPSKKVTKPKSPIESHDLIYAGIYAGIQNEGLDQKARENYIDLSLRFFTHEFTESDIGYVSYSEIQALKTTVRFPENGKPIFQHIDVASFSQVPIEYPFDRMPAFKFDLDVTQRIYSDCDNCLGTKLDVAYGAARDLFDHKMSIYLMGRLSQSFSAFGDESYVYSLGPEVGFVSQLSDNIKLRFFYSPQISGKSRFNFHHTLLESTLKINIKSSIYFRFEDYNLFTAVIFRQKSARDIKLGYQYYF